MTLQIGKRIVFDKMTGEVIVDLGEMHGDVLPRKNIMELDYVDLEYEQDADKFSKARAFHIDPKTKEVIFDELIEPALTPEEQIAQLQQQLAEAQAALNAK